MHTTEAPDRSGRAAAAPRAAAPGPAPAGDADVFHEALAERLSARLAYDARYVAAWNRWLLYDGTAWRPDETLRVLNEARAVCRAAAHAAGDARAKLRIGSAAMVAAIERLARADQRLAASADQWDADPWLLNTPAGTFELHTGDMRPHEEGDYITRVTAVAPSGDGHGDCPLFRAFLARIFAKDAALIAFVQRALGSALAGVVAEPALFFGYGTGGNGKSVLLNTVVDILGGYAAVAPIASFTATSRARHAADLAMCGARLIVAHETAHGATWDGDRIKALSGGDPIVARPMRGPVLTRTPRFKLFIAGNAKPTLRTVDMGIRRRLKLIPFAVTIPEAEVDPLLRGKLEAEWPGILAWLIAGCREWRRIGLAPPPSVTGATAEYLAEEDTFGGWLEEWVSPAPESATETTANLFSSWESYAAWAQEPAGSRKAFGQAMRARGFVPCRIGKERAKGFNGISLRRHSDAAVMMAAMAGRKTPFEGL